MSNERWIKQLGRLYKEVPSEGSTTGANAYANQFNNILEKIQKENPDNEFIQNIEEINAVGGTQLFAQADTNREVKMKCGMLADDLGYELPEEQLDKSTDMTVISLESNQSQTAEQNVTQEVSIENAMEMVNYTTLSQDKKVELKDIIQDFDEELSKEEPDPSTLRHYVSQAKKYSVDVAAKMSMLALQSGLVGILEL